MTLSAVAFPQLDNGDNGWIQAVRTEYDPYYERIAPHFTLIFPNEQLPASELVNHVQLCCHRQAPFSFRIRYAVTAPNSFTEEFHVFLVPDEGLSRLWRLHDRLYKGPLAPALRLDIPFVPHITIAGGLTSAAAQTVSERLNQDPFLLAGTVATVTVVEFNDRELSQIATVPLTG